MKIGLVLEGGANRGVFTSGVLDYFMEQDLGKAFRYVIGTSAGAGNAMNFISGQHGRSRDTTITKDKRYAYFGLKNIIRTGHLFDMENIYWRVPTEYNLFDFDAYFRNPIEREYTAKLPDGTGGISDGLRHRPPLSDEYRHGILRPARRNAGSCHQWDSLRRWRCCGFHFCPPCLRKGL